MPIKLTLVDNAFHPVKPHPQIYVLLIWGKTCVDIVYLLPKECQKTYCPKNTRLAIRAADPNRNTVVTMDPTWKRRGRVVVGSVASAFVLDGDEFTSETV